MDRHYFPLTPESATVLAWAGKAPPQVLNVGLKIDIFDDIDEKTFLDAAVITVERLPYCRFRLHRADDNSIVQYISEMDEQDVCEIVDVSGESEKRINKQFKKWASTPFPNKLMDTQLFVMKLIRMPGGKHSLFFCMHHAITDIYAVSHTISYLDKVYYALTTGTELPNEGADPEEAILDRFSYLESDRCKKDVEWWTEWYKTEPRFTSVNGIGGREFIKGKNYGKDMNLLQMKAKNVRYLIPPELVKKLDELSAKTGIAPSIYYRMAIRAFLARTNKTDDVTIRNVIALRATVKEKTCGLFCTAVIFTRPIFPESETFSRGCEIMEESNRAQLRHARAPGVYDTIPDTLFGKPKGTTYYTVTFSYVSYVDYSKIHLNVEAHEMFSGIALAPIYMLVMPFDASGDLYAVYQYSTGFCKKGTVEKMHNFIIRFLEAAVETPDATLKDLTDKAMA